MLLTAPPALIETATHTLNLGGVLAFLGIAYGSAAIASFDSNLVHHKKIQIRASDAVPALYFPLCIDLVESGMIDLKSLISSEIYVGGCSRRTDTVCPEPRRSM